MLLTSHGLEQRRLFEAVHRELVVTAPHSKRDAVVRLDFRGVIVSRACDILPTCVIPVGQLLLAQSCAAVPSGVLALNTGTGRSRG